MTGPIYPESQPDTQPVTQPLDAGSCDDVYMPPHYWGRLYPATLGVNCQDLTLEHVVIGKTSSCGIKITENEVSNSIWSVISKKHFSVSRTVSNKDPLLNIKIELTDSSLNGTFVNGMRVPRGKPIQLHTNDVIAVAKPEFKLFIFMESSPPGNEHNIINKHYDISKQLGMGSYGEVKLIFSKITGQGFAMKTINKTRFVNIDQKMNIEIKILQKINHPNVIKLIEEYDSPTYKYLILEFMEGGDLCKRICRSQYLPEPQAKLYFYQLVSGMAYLHDQGIVHRDLKPENVLLASNDVNTIVKITDFGLSKILESGSIMQTICGTKLYVAPEILESLNNTSYTGKVDVWSLGVILFVCLSGKTPFSPPDERNGGKSLEEQILEAKFSFKDRRWPSVSRDAKMLIRKMLTRDPNKRISVASVKKFPWLKDDEVESKVREIMGKLRCTASKPNLVEKENKRSLNSSAEELRGPTKRQRMEMDFP